MWLPVLDDDVMLLASAIGGARGVQRLKDALPLIDGGAASPKETWLRLLFIDAGMPSPPRRYPLSMAGGGWFGCSDMGWEDFMVAVGVRRRSTSHGPDQYVRTSEPTKIEKLGWIVDPVIKEDRPKEIVHG